MQAQAGAVRQVRVPEGRRGHAGGVFLRKGVIHSRRPHREEAALPLQTAFEMLLGGERRLQHEVQTLPELLHLHDVLRQEAHHVRVPGGAGGDVQARGARHHRVHLQRTGDLVRVHHGCHEGRPGPASGACDQRVPERGAPEAALRGRRRDQPGRQRVHRGFLRQDMRGAPRGCDALGPHHPRRRSPSGDHLPRDPRTQRLGGRGRIVLRMGPRRTRRGRARPLHQVPSGLRDDGRPHDPCGDCHEMPGDRDGSTSSWGTWSPSMRTTRTAPVAGPCS